MRAALAAPAFETQVAVLYFVQLASARVGGWMWRGGFLEVFLLYLPRFLRRMFFWRRGRGDGSDWQVDCYCWRASGTKLGVLVWPVSCAGRFDRPCMSASPPARTLDRFQINPNSRAPARHCQGRWLRRLGGRDTSNSNYLGVDIVVLRLRRRGPTRSITDRRN